jgi:ABC-type Mn2+/Zn2+ transport system permease subunit
MSFFTELWSQEFMRRALFGSVLIGMTNGLLGAFIILRRMSLMADALSHSMLPGLALGMLFFGLNPGGLFLGGQVAALFVALGAMLIARTSRLKEDTTLAILYTFAFAVGILIIGFLPSPKPDLKHYLFGDVLGMDNADLWTSYGVALAVIPGIVLFLRPLLLTIFDAAVARSQGVRVGLCQTILVVGIVLTMVSSARALGVILMLGLLVTPAATMYLLTDNFNRMMWGGGLLGAVAAVIGLILSYRVDSIPSGAAIVLVLFVFFLLALIGGPRYGLLVRLRRTRHFHKESLERWEHETEEGKK